MTARTPRSWIVPAALFGLAVVVRSIVACRVQLPGRDGATYLWMAERVAQGDFAAAFQTVFHPLYSLLTAALLAVLPGLGIVTAGKVMACGCGALATLPLWSLTRHLFGDRAAVVTSVFYAVGIWFARHPADCMSEGPFYLFVACAVQCLICGRGHGSAIAAGILTGLAYGTRPEGVILAVVGVPWLFLCGQRGRSLALALSALSVSALLPLGYALLGPGFTLTPKAAFNLAVGAGRETDGGLIFYLENMLRLPGHVFAAVAFPSTALAIYGVWHARPWGFESRRSREDSPRAGATLLFGLFLVQCLVIPLVRSTIRFLSGYGLLLLPFAGSAWRELAPRRRRISVLLLVVAVLPDLWAIPQSQREDKVALQELGLYLRERMTTDELLVSAERRARSGVTDRPFSMCRVEFFAGRKPSPPRPLEVAEVLAVADDRNARFALIGSTEPFITVAQLEARGFRLHMLPTGLAERVAARNILVFERAR